MYTIPSIRHSRISTGYTQAVFAVGAGVSVLGTRDTALNSNSSEHSALGLQIPKSPSMQHTSSGTRQLPWHSSKHWPEVQCIELLTCPVIEAPHSHTSIPSTATSPVTKSPALTFIISAIGQALINSAVGKFI
jgi:hypothetical protein